MLLPMRWRPKSQPDAMSTWFLVLNYSAAITIFTIVYIARLRASWATLSAPARATTTDGCGKDVLSMPKSEQLFQIDTPVRSNLSFAEAKLVDLAWDIGIGLGGRMLHAWVWYYVACKTTTWVLESSALSLSAIINLLFWPDSSPALVSLIRSIFARQPFKVLLAMVFLAYGVAHVLIFGVIWSAATGYQSTTVAAYPMPNQTWVTKDSEQLTVCWWLKPQGLEATPIKDTIILGPSLASFELDAFASLGNVGMWRGFRRANASEAFQNIHACKRQYYISGYHGIYLSADYNYYPQYQTKKKLIPSV